MNRLTCAEAVARLDDYLDRELPAESLAAVAAHLEVCANCAGHFGIEQEVLDRIRGKLRRVAAPPDLLARISRSLRRAEGQESGG